MQSPGLFPGSKNIKTKNWVFSVFKGIAVGFVISQFIIATHSPILLGIPGAEYNCVGLVRYYVRMSSYYITA